MPGFSELRENMVARQIAARGVRSEKVLSAMRKVPRERFLPEGLAEFAYEDSPLPLEAGQTISQPYIVAFMTEALALQGGEKVLEIGTGSGYAAAILGEIAGEVYTIEFIQNLAESAANILADLGYDNVQAIHGDGTLGWTEHAPYDGIIVAAGGPEVPESLKQQLKVGGHLIIPVGKQKDFQELTRVTRISETEYETEGLADVRFVPLVGEEGWFSESVKPEAKRIQPIPATPREQLRSDLADACEPFNSLDTADLDPLLERIGDSQVVLIGEATHGTSEFYRMRNRISAELIEKKGFRFVAIEGDWPDAARIDHYVRHFDYPPSEWTAFARFPTWMWRNNEVREFVDWLREYNVDNAPDSRVAFHGLDLYSLYSSIRSILKYLDEVDPATADIARARYGCLTPWQTDPATYGHAALTGTYRSCEGEVLQVLGEVSRRHREYAEHDGERFLDAVQNARLVANAERYYRVMYYGSRESWNLRDTYMFETLKRLQDFYGPDCKAIVWAHNSHVGAAAATEMAARGETNIGNLCRGEFGDGVYSIGFGTDNGTVAAASNWDGQMEIKNIVPSRDGSYENLFHNIGLPGFLLGMRHLPASSVRTALSESRLERAIGVLYRPETELASHYFRAVLSKQFDEYIWMDTTQAVHPFETAELAGLPDTYPFGL
jgi:protein-L-isoaspartate(D-aspartate) O-methyltransferase